ncbi:hypothetical protein CVT30_00465 [Streptomyces sp. AMCC400023]|nr:hypothetical protein CVT30_00465 [Streptomyces sp. AMCC400023]
MYPGTFVTCVHNPDRALCRAPAEACVQPVLAHCQPLACRNTALTPANHEALSTDLTQLEDALDDGARPGCASLLATIRRFSDQIGRRLRGRRGGRQPAFDAQAYKQRRTVER